MEKSDNPLVILGKSIKQGSSKGLALIVGPWGAIIPAIISKNPHERLAGIIIGIAIITSPIWVTGYCIYHAIKPTRQSDSK